MSKRAAAFAAMTAVFSTAGAACSESSQPSAGDAVPTADAISGDRGTTDRGTMADAPARDSARDLTGDTLAREGPPLTEAGVIDPGPVICREDEDCGNPSLICLKHIPGGHCKGCDTQILCPTELKCFQGICVRPCGGDEDCNIGMRCNPLTKTCAGRGCGPGCPSTYPCNFPFCERPKCDQGQACPDPLVCDGEWCMEP